MKIMTRTALFLVGVLIMTSSCVSSKKHKDLLAEKEALMNRYDKCNEEKKELAGQIRDLEGEKSKMKTQLANKDRELVTAAKNLDDCNEKSERRAAQLKAVKKQINEAVATLSESGLSVKERGAKLYVTLSNTIMYKPGSAEVSSEGKDIINRLADVFKKNPSMEVMVEGHTDAQPVRRSRYLHKDNWALSANRSANVIRALEDAGVPASQLVLAGRADTDKVIDTEAGKEEGSANRRIEFILSPENSEALNKLAN